MFRAYADADALTQPDRVATHKADALAIEEVIPKSFGMISECIVSFENRKPADVQKQDRVQCSVGRESGWLRIEFEIASRRYSFLFSPNGKVP